MENFKEIEELAQQKEKEWRNVTSLQISTLQKELSHQQMNYKDLNGKFIKLKEDFKYNLKLLQERDKELKQYDDSFTRVKAMESAHIAEISDLRIKLAANIDKLEQEMHARSEMQRHYRQRLIDQQAEMEAFKSAKDAEIEETMAQLIQMKNHNERIQTQLRSEIESQRIELTSELDDALRRKDREYQEREDQVKADLLSHQLKTKLIEKEMELVKSAQEKQAETLQEADNAGANLRKQLQQAEWDIKDISAVKNARILELEAQVQSLQSREKSLSEDFNHKHQELDRDMRIKQSKIDAERKKFSDKENSLNKEIRKLQSKLECSEHETRRALWDKNDFVKEQEVMKDSYEKTIQDLNIRIQSMTKEHSSSAVSKDVEIQNLKKKEDLMKSELGKLKDDIDRYKKELAYAAQRENLLLQSKVQLKLDWQQRCEEIERKQYDKSEELIQSLTKSRDLALAQVRKLRKEYGIDLGEEDNIVENDSLKILQEQNEQLKAVIQQMTVDMQNMADQKRVEPDLNKSQIEDTLAPSPMKYTPEYVKSLEEEVTKLRREKRKLDESSVQETAKDASSTPVITASFGHPDVKAHINSLNQTIGLLRSQQTDSAAKLQKAQVRIQHQEEQISHQESDGKKHFARIQELEYEMLSQNRRNEQEMASQKRRVSDLELLLAEARREADEYYKGGIQNNLRATELGNQLSQLAVDAMAKKSSSMTGIAQVGVVRQLQSEITNLRSELATAKQALILDKGNSKPTKAALLNKQLHGKLRLAAEQIASLMREKAILLESGNSLRAELSQYKKDQSQEIPTKIDMTKDKAGAGGDGVEVQKNKLDKLEDLQYQLTRQELQYAQRISPRKDDSEKNNMKQSTHTSSTPNQLQQKSSEVKQVPTSGSSDLFQYSLSTVGDGSINDVWKMLDQEPSSPSLPGSREDTISGAYGKQIQPQKQRPGKISSLHSKGKENFHRSKAKRRVPKIRNYNVKD